ncbi:MAG: enoyl-CoA hydratase-related protein, partial [Thermoplasmata archaeon]|nr:enoyl-CoA hydratase-related protein [Thermoplasmata archaeon]
MTRRTIAPGSTVAVLGAGNMGSGIAQAVAQAGYIVRVRDVSDAMLARGRSLVTGTLEGGIQRKKLTPEKRDEILGRIAWTTDVAESVRGCSLVVEAVFEEEAVKRAVFEEVARSVPDTAIVATNTSSLSVSRLADTFPEPSRFAGLHFFFPAAINRLLEVVGGAKTDPAVLDELDRFGYRLRKIPIRVTDSAGFAVNRYFVPYLNESVRLAEEGLASMATIEGVGRSLFGASLGPFELMNATGVTIAYHSMESLMAAFGSAYAPAKLLESQFRAAQPWGWKETAVDPSQEPAVRDRLLGLVFGIATRLVEEGVASPEAVDRGATIGLRWSRGPFQLLNDFGLDEGLRLVRAFASKWGEAFPVSRDLAERVGQGRAVWPLRLVRVERRGSVAWVLLDRPEVLNSLNSAMLRDLGEVFHGLEGDRTVRCVVVAGSSPVFAAGADIGEMEGKDLAEGRAFGFLGQGVCKRIEEFPAPVFALVEGYALGGGLEIALACDFILAATGAKLGLPEATVGIHPGFGGASRLTRLIGPARTKLLIYSATPVTATEAERLGVVARLVPEESSREEASALAAAIAERAPLALSWVKSVINRGGEASLDTALRLEGESAGHTFATADRSEGMRAFRERRPPKF